MIMPMIQRGAATQHNPIRCKTLLRQVEEQILANGLRSHETEELLQPIQQLLPNHDFWQRQSHGLALFIASLAGHGVDVEDSAHEPHDAILRYCQQVDKGLRAFLGKEHAPLVLAGVQYLLPIYQRANTYPYLLEEGITRSPERLRPEELQERAWALVQPHFQQAREGAAARYRQLVGTGRAISDIQAIVMAAYEGRIDTLFVAVGVQQWGSFDSGSRTVEVHQEAEAGEEDLLDVAAMYTLLRRGSVHALAPESVSEGIPAAAITRY